MKKYIIIIIAIVAGSCFSAAYAQTLDDYCQVAAENNPGLQAKYKNFEAAMQTAAQVGSLPDPNLSFGYFISPVETRVGPQRAQFSLTQQFPWWGTLKAQKKAATLLAEAKYQAFLDARNQLFFQVSAAYYPLYEVQKLMAIEEKNLSILSLYHDLATVKFKNGKGSMVDVLRVDIMQQEATTKRSILHQQKTPLETRFNKLLNRANGATILMRDSLIVEGIVFDEQREAINPNHPLLDELALKVQASKAREQIAHKRGLPKFGVGLNYMLVDQRTDMAIIDNGKDAFMPMLSVSLPLFRGQYKAAQQEAQLMQASFTLQKEEVLNRLTSTYETVWFEVQKQAKLLQLYDRQIQTSEQALRLLFTTYSQSGTDLEDVLRMQQQILNYQTMKATAFTKYHVALAQLHYITTNTKS